VELDFKMGSIAAICAILVVLLASASALTKVRDERIPGELHLVNEGIAHDDSHWYFSNQHFLYQATVSPVTIEQSNHAGIPEDLLKLTYNHIGDIDVLDGIIYGGMEAKEGNGILATWNTTDLQLIRYRVTEQKDMPWVAIKTDTRRIYSCIWGDTDHLQIYDLDTFEFVGTHDMLPGILLPKEIQGGAFYEGELYLSTNLEDAVWKLNLDTGALDKVVSDPYNFHEYEMEGITFWDLRDRGLGVMHIFGNFMQVREKAIRNYTP